MYQGSFQLGTMSKLSPYPSQPFTPNAKLYMRSVLPYHLPEDEIIKFINMHGFQKRDVLALVSHTCKLQIKECMTKIIFSEFIASNQT